MGFDLHTGETNDPKSVRNWCIHMMANIASMSAIAMGYDTSVISDTMALDSFRLDIGLLSALGTYRDTLKFGRRKAIFVAATVFVTGGVFTTAATACSPCSLSDVPPPSGSFLGLRLVRGALLLLGMLKCPESLRWLANHDRWGEAEKVFVGLRALPADPQYIRGELSEIHQ
ncbi:uncharacterized protein HRG_09866 [Hirsutella rhossiliensis]|uniref:Uncharacterized protein n=1 Tax=Hirsutella rhossiliensis TaxID=111463 RepID=A0A9P8SFA5_9HYPO|nr:uncharacterized protein HRG_09866 [Hirsutella rhossiliensis]KAH0958821.1 hypothetical protein HRG_09866 [Hirsutella rhossiliensis]